MKKVICYLMMLMIMMMSAISFTACTYDDGTDLDDYDYNDNGEMETDEFQDATEDFMDENGF